MSVTDSGRVYEFVGSGSDASPYSFPATLRTDDELVAQVRVIATGVEQTALILNTDYSVTLTSDKSSATVTLISTTNSNKAFASGNQFIIKGVQPLEQDQVYSNQDGFQEDVIEGSLDKVTLQVQTLQEEMNRTIRVQDTSPLANLPNKLGPLIANKGKVVGVNTAGTAIELITTGVGQGDVTGPASSTDNAIARFDSTTGKIIQNSAVTISDAGEVSVTIGSNSPLEVYNSITANLTTGMAKGGILSTGTGADEFSITDGFGWIVNAYTDPANPTYTKVTWTGKQDITVTNPSNLVNWVYIDATGSVIQQATDFTPQQRRSVITLGPVLSADGVNVTGITQEGDGATTVGTSFYDFTEAIGNINIAGNEFTAAASTLTIARSAGTTFLRSINVGVDPADPNRRTTASSSPDDFFYGYSDGSGGITLVAVATNVDPDQYDDGSGTLAALANNKWTNQRIYFFASSGVSIIQYGQTVFNSQADAEAGVDSENFAVLPPLNGESIRTTLTLKKGTTDLSSVSNATFTHTGKFGFGVGNSASGGAGTQDLQDTYNLSVDPEITTDATRGALSVKRGSAADTDAVFEGLNGAGTQTFKVTGDGDVTLNALEVNDDITLGSGGVNKIWTKYVNPADMTVGHPTAPPSRGSYATAPWFFDTLDFDQTTAEFTGFTLDLGDDYDGSALTFEAKWTAGSGTGTVSWLLEPQIFADSDTLVTAGPSNVSLTDTLLSVDDVHVVSNTITPTGAGTGHLLICTIRRNTAADTLNADALLIGISVSYT